MKKSILFIWQLGVNVIGLPELYKVERIDKINVSRYFSTQNKKELRITKYQ